MKYPKAMRDKERAQQMKVGQGFRLNMTMGGHTTKEERERNLAYFRRPAYGKAVPR